MECMLCHKLDVPQSEYFNFYVEQKYDGVRVLIDKSGDDVRVYGRRNAETKKQTEFTQKLPEIVEWIRALPIHSVMLDGELLSDDFLTLQTKVRTTTQFIDDPNLHLMVFDWPGPGTWLQRRNNLEVLFSENKNARIGLSPIYLLDRPIEDVGLFCQANKIEGVILKDPHGLYEPGKRSRAWYKYTPFFEGDFRVVGKTPGTGKNTNTLGAVICETSDGVQFKAGTGLTDSDRDLIWNMDPLPNFVKLKYKELHVKTGKPRMPVVLEFFN